MRGLSRREEEGACGCSAHRSTSQPDVLGDRISSPLELWAPGFLLLCWKRGEEIPNKPVSEVTCIWAVA